MTFYSQLRYRLWRIYRLFRKPCAIEINLVSHCNINCVGCTHYSPIAPKSYISIEDFKRSISHLKRIESAYGILRILGGEPLMHPEILEILKLAGEILRNKKIEVYTNGILLASDKQGDFVDSFAEICYKYGIHVYVTIYPIAVDYDMLFEKMTQRSVNIVLMGDRRNRESFRLMRLDPARSGKRSNYYICTETDCMQLVEDRIYPCSESAYCSYVNEKYGLNFCHRAGDYIKVAEIKHFYSLWWFRIKSKPFCEYCTFPRSTIDWSHSRCAPEEWVEMH